MTKSVIMIGVALALTMGVPAEAGQKYCEATVAERLDRLNVEPSDIRGIDYVKEHSVRRRHSDRVAGFTAWVSLKSCRGSLVIDMSRYCRVRQVYGRGACDLGGAIETWRY